MTIAQINRLLKPNNLRIRKAHGSEPGFRFTFIDMTRRPDGTWEDIGKRASNDLRLLSRVYRNLAREGWI